MKSWALEYLCCPRTRSPLTLRNEVREGEEIVRGTLVSAEGQEYPIRDGIPRLLVDYTSREEAETIEAFSSQWDKFQSFDGFFGSTDVFFTHFSTLQSSEVPGKVILDAGCGNGRFLGPIANLGAKRVIGLDYSTSVRHAHAKTRDLPNVTVVQGSILEPPFRTGVFDLIFSMGVIDHLNDPEKGMKALGQLLTDQGRVAVWIYAYEGNELYLRLVKPLRYLGPKMPPWMLLSLSYGLAVPVWIHSRTVNRWLGVRRDGSQRLPMGQYFQWLLNLRFRDIACIIYDQLSHPLVNYYRRHQAEALFRNVGLNVDQLHAPRSNSWSIAGTRARLPLNNQNENDAVASEVLPCRTT